MSMQIFPSNSLGKRAIKTCFAQGLVLCMLAFMPMISVAVLQDEIQVYDDEINAKGGVLGKKLEPVWLTRPPTGPCSPKKPSNC